MSGQYSSYDYAWKVPGWSVQNPVVPDSGPDGYVDPGMPEDVPRVRITQVFEEMGSGRPLEGVLRVRTRQPLVHEVSGAYYPAGHLLRVRFNRYRPLDVYLPATDSTTLHTRDNAPWKYHALLTVRGEQQEFEFSLPEASPAVNILDLIPVS